MTLQARPPETLLSVWGYTRARRIQEGKCPGCGGEIEGDVRRTASGVKKRMCRSCLKKNSRRMSKEREKRAANGLCTRCGKGPPKEGVRQCQKCSDYTSKISKNRIIKTFFEKRARNGSSLGYSVLSAKMLWSLWKEQKGRCALTGVKLGRDNSELDHIVAISKGGTGERSNLRWLHRDVNQAKRALSDLEFLDLCKRVIAFSKGKK